MLLVGVPEEDGRPGVRGGRVRPPAPPAGQTGTAAPAEDGAESASGGAG